MTRVFLISEQSIRQNTLINDNVNAEYIKQAIIESQIGLENALGSRIYNGLLKIASGSTGEWTPSDEWTELLNNHVQVYLLNAVTANIVFPLTFKIREQGVVSANSQYYQTSTTKEAEALENHYGNLAENAKNRMIEYVVANAGVFGICSSDPNWLQLNSKPNCPIYFRK